MKMDDQPELPFEKIWGYLNLKNLLRSKTVSDDGTSRPTALK